MAVQKPRSKAGFVYVLSNESMPGIVKIGMTGRNPEIRLREINSATGVLPFKLEAVITSRNAKWTERAVHERLARHRIREDREFFRIGPADARKVIFDVARSQSRKAYGRAAWNRQMSPLAAALLALALVPAAGLLSPVLIPFWLVICLLAAISGRPAPVREYLGMAMRPGAASAAAAIGVLSALIAYGARPEVFPLAGSAGMPW